MATIREQAIQKIEAEGYVRWRFDVGARTGELSNRWDCGPYTITLYACTFDKRKDGILMYHGDQIELLRDA